MVTVKLSDFLRLVRWPNLLIVAITMCLMRYGIMVPMLAVNDIGIQMPLIDFCVLVLSVILITAAGNVVNDYFDVETDNINRPEKVLADKVVSRNALLNIYLVLNFTGFLLAFFISWKLELWNLVIIHLLASGLLYFYSSEFKRMPVIGNVVVALLSGLVPFMAGLYEWIYEAKNLEKYWFNFDFIWGYAGFAFLISWIREIIKDMQDVKGDRASGQNTLPVVAGIAVARWMAIVLLLIMMLLLAWLMHIQYSAGDYLSFNYILIALQLPLTYLTIITFRADATGQFRTASLVCKAIMLLGIAYTGIILLSLSQ